MRALESTSSMPPALACSMPPLSMMNTPGVVLDFVRLNGSTALQRRMSCTHAPTKEDTIGSTVLTCAKSDMPKTMASVRSFSTQLNLEHDKSVDLVDSQLPIDFLRNSSRSSFLQATSNLSHLHGQTQNRSRLWKVTMALGIPLPSQTRHLQMSPKVRIGRLHHRSSLHQLSRTSQDTSFLLPTAVTVVRLNT